ncbi:MAG: cyclase family protein [Actinomycetia bacterium]|nr:cyclase family protein [Actinomycetes bacterium]
MPLLDVSQPYYVGMTVPPGSPPPAFRPVSRIGEQVANVTEFTFRTHMGTHVDAPYHFIATGKRLDQIPIERFTGQGFVVPAPLPPLTPVHREDLAPWADRIRGLDFVLFSFRWASYFGTEEYFRHPYLAEDAAEELVRLGVRCVGVDTYTPDTPVPIRTPEHRGPTHLVLLGHDVLIIENLASLVPVEGRAVRVYAFPLKIRDADGAPARVVVEWEEEAS